MKFTLSWLKEHLETEATPARIEAALTALGLEVEQVTDHAAALAPFTVAHILHAERHPNAEKLQVCRVMSDAGELQIVCGAANARAGLKVVLAKEGAVIPGNGMKIKKSAIRGVESQGMLCSAEELGLANESEGIIELPENAAVGASAASALGADDVLFDIAITPNRSDALGVYGIARDLAAAGLGLLKKLPHKPHQGTFPSPIGVDIKAALDCPLFVGCTIRNVTNPQSPEWLKRKLLAIGLRPISALVDITNYMTFAYGRPLHVFDADRLDGAIQVRHAKAGEKLEALNGKTYELLDGMTVIADQSKALALGGIIGGTETGCTEKTRNVFLEAALFRPENIAATGRALQIDSDARYRFERGVDPAFTQTGAEIAIQLIIEICGGEASDLVVAGKLPAAREAISFRPSQVADLGGFKLSDNSIADILKKLGCTVATGLPWQVTPPSWRPDIAIEADLVEEVLRIAGYDHVIPAHLPAPAQSAGALLTPLQKRLQIVRRALSTQGMSEIHSWSFVSEKEAALFGGQDSGLQLANPISEELSVMRPSVLAGLLSATHRNGNRGYYDLALFEVGPAFHKAVAGGQSLRVAGARTGTCIGYDYASQPLKREARQADVFDAKADAALVLAQFGLSLDKLELVTDAPAWYHPGRSARITLGGKITLGWFGELHPQILSAFDIRQSSVAAFEIDLSAIPAPKSKGKARPALAASDFQRVTRDFAFVVPAELGVAQLTRTIAKADDTLIRQVTLFDVYAGKGVPEGRKSVALQVVLQAGDRTLTDDEINTVAKKIVDTAAKSGAELRA